MCNFETPLECKRPSQNDWLFDAAEKMAAPNFNTIKKNIDKINSRINEIKNDPAFNRTPIPMGLMREFQQLMRKRDNFLYDLRSHPNYETFKKEMKEKRKKAIETLKSIAKLSEKEREEFFNKWKLRAMPKKSKLLGALSNINHALASIVDDKFWCKAVLRKRRYKELIVYRNQICRKLLKYPPTPKESIECFRFKPCGLKIVKVWEYASKNKRGNLARFLKFGFDKDTDRIGIPKYHLIVDAIEKHKKFIAELQFQVNEKLVETKEEKKARLKKLTEKLENCKKRKEFLVELKKKIDEQRVNTNAQQDSKPKKEFPPPGFWSGDKAKDFANKLELPSKQKLEGILEFQKKLLDIIERDEKMKMSPPGNEQEDLKDNKSQQSGSDVNKKGSKGDQKKNRSSAPQPSTSRQASGSKKISRSSAPSKTSISKNKKPSTVTIQENDEKSSKSFEPRKNICAIRTLKDGLTKNIKFIEDFLEKYPQSGIKLHACKEDPLPDEPNRKKFDVQNEAGSENFSMPRYRTLKDNLEIYKKFIKQFESDIKNQEILEAYTGQSDCSSDDDDENKNKSQKNKKMNKKSNKTSANKKSKTDMNIETEKRIPQYSTVYQKSVYDMQPNTSKVNSQLKKADNSSQQGREPQYSTVYQKSVYDIEPRIQPSKIKVSYQLKKTEDSKKRKPQYSTVYKKSVYDMQPKKSKVCCQVKKAENSSQQERKPQYSTVYQTSVYDIQNKRSDSTVQQKKSANELKSKSKQSLKQNKEGRENNSNNSHEDKKLRKLESNVEFYARLKRAQATIEELIQRHEQRAEEMNSQDTNGPSYFTHNKLCNRDEEEKKPRKEYKLTRRRKSISLATEARMRYARSKRMEWIEKSLKLRNDGNEIKRILNNLAANRECNEDGEDESDNQRTEFSNRVPYLCRYLKHLFILDEYLIEVEDEKEDTIHAQSHMNADAHFFPVEKTFFDFSKKGPADMNYTENLAKPKSIVLQSTLENFSMFMTDDRKEKIKDRMGVRNVMRPEDMEPLVRSVPKPKPKIKDQSKKIKAHLSKQVYEQLAKILKKKIAKEMSQPNRHKAVSLQFREVEKTIFMFLMAINEVPRSHHESEMYHKFTSVVTEFLLKALGTNLEK